MTKVAGDTAENVRRCVVCHAPYAGSERFCPIDGGAIVAGQPTSDAEDPHLGKTIDGRHLVRRLIGRGGLGSVYEADHIGLDKRVAIKFLLGAPPIHICSSDRDASVSAQRAPRARSHGTSCRFDVGDEVASRSSPEY
jgi:hypothetical protein